MEGVTKLLNNVITTIFELECTMRDFSDHSQILLLNRVNTLTEKLIDLQNLQLPVESNIPAPVLRLVDEGNNPDEFTLQAVKQCIKRKKVTKSKVQAFKSLRKRLLVGIEEHFPEDLEAYRKLQLESRKKQKVDEKELHDPPVNSVQEVQIDVQNTDSNSTGIENGP